MSTPPLPRGDEEDLEVDSDELAWDDRTIRTTRGTFLKRTHDRSHLHSLADAVANYSYPAREYLL